MGSELPALLLAFIGAVIVYLANQVYQHRRKFRDLPGPPHSFVWGHLRILANAAGKFPANTHLQNFITEIAHQYDLKGIWYLDLWPLTFCQVIVTDPELMDQMIMMNQHQMFDDKLSPLIGSNVVATANGAIWKKLHNSMAPAFALSHVRTQVGLLTDQTLLLRDTFKRLAKSKSVISLETELSKLTFDIVGRIIFNFPLDAQTKGSPWCVLSALAILENTTHVRPQVNNLEDLQMISKLVVDSMSMSPLVKLQLALKKKAITRRVDASITAKINERFIALRDQNVVPSRKEPYSVIDLMLRDKIIEGNKSKSSIEIPREEMTLLVTNVKGLLLGAQGTTVDSLCFTFMMLSTHPEVLQKVREEHDAVFGETVEATLQTLEASPRKLEELPYSTAVLKEALRMFPINFSVKQAKPGATATYQGRKYPIDEDLAIVLEYQHLHYNPAYYPEPDEFKPERFLGDGVPRSWWRSFSRGPRSCVGQDLAMNIMHTVLLLTLREFDFACHGLKPNAQPRALHTRLDTIYGDVIHQESSPEAKPRGGMMMTISETANQEMTARRSSNHSHIPKCFDSWKWLDRWRILPDRPMERASILRLNQDDTAPGILEGKGWDFYEDERAFKLTDLPSWKVEDPEKPHMICFLSNHKPLTNAVPSKAELQTILWTIASRILDETYHSHRIIPVTVLSAAGYSLRITQGYVDREQLFIRMTPIIDFTAGQKKKWDDFIQTLCWIVGDPVGITS
ncbi:cytochrome P450 [Hypoxylon sp. FL1284]|nr:cytochrome P450 [Hypoxylon sp. FL1284]